MSSSDPLADFKNFFTGLGNLNTADQVTAFFQYYWYVWLILSLAVVAIIAVNAAIIYYFCHHRRLNKLDPNTGDKRLYDKDWGMTKPQQSVFIPVEQNKQEQEEETPEDIADYDDGKFAIEALMEHNQFRIQHGAAPLIANEYLNKAAADWARELARMNELRHSPDQWRRYQGSVLGESLAYFIGPILRGDRMTEMWYREVRRHDFNSDLQENSLHFSQLIWKNTREVGFGRCQTEDKKQWYGVALYYPPGNFPNQFALNVQPRSDMEDFRLA
ncbi:unnamed protein product [Adineta ricciae]|uniref:SCP domain-containing protein n=1 Tax=Adineta ricciae TaxID=249248 RepID=A0A814NEL4_ADIRI|nr:unnamed protein product [Adineta ricciae]CAF1175577.1 unnamed protein product [Adineta ricciae]